MYLFSKKQNGQQRYTELIRNVTGKWPNWDPATPMNATSTSVTTNNAISFRDQWCQLRLDPGTV